MYIPCGIALYLNFPEECSLKTSNSSKIRIVILKVSFDIKWLYSDVTSY